MKAGPVIIPAAFIVAITALGLAGEQDYQDAQTQQERYCELVAAGAWPDFRGDFEELCHDKR